MSPLEQVALAWQAMLRTFAELGRPSTWAPWLVMGAVQVVLILLLWNFAHPALSAWMMPVVRALGGEEALHYPGLFRALPGMYATVDLVIGALVGSVMVGAGTLIFADRFLGRPASPGASLWEAGRRGLTLIVAQLPFHLLALAFGLGLGGWLESKNRSTMVAVIGTILTVAGSVVAQSLFFYVAALVMLEHRSAWGALRQAPRTWSRGFWAATFLGVLLLLALVPFQILQGQAALIADRGRPELIAALALAQAVFTLLLWYLLSGSATLIYLAAMTRHGEDE